MRKRGGAGLPFRPLRGTGMPAAGPEGRRRGRVVPEKERRPPPSATPGRHEHWLL